MLARFLLSSPPFIRSSGLSGFSFFPHVGRHESAAERAGHDQDRQAARHEEWPGRCRPDRRSARLRGGCDMAMSVPAAPAVAKNPTITVAKKTSIPTAPQGGLLYPPAAATCSEKFATPPMVMAVRISRTAIGISGKNVATRATYWIPLRPMNATAAGEHNHDGGMNGIAPSESHGPFLHRNAEALAQQSGHAIGIHADPAELQYAHHKTGKDQPPTDSVSGRTHHIQRQARFSYPADRARGRTGSGRSEPRLGSPTTPSPALQARCRRRVCPRSPMPCQNTNHNITPAYVGAMFLYRCLLDSPTGRAWPMPRSQADSQP